MGIPKAADEKKKADGAGPVGKPNLICQDNGPLQAGLGLC